MSELIQELMDKCIKPMMADIVALQAEVNDFRKEYLRQSAELMAYRIAVTSLIAHPNRSILEKALPEQLAGLESTYVNSDCSIDEQIEAVQRTQAHLLRSLFVSKMKPAGRAEDQPSKPSVTS